LLSSVSAVALNIPDIVITVCPCGSECASDFVSLACAVVRESLLSYSLECAQLPLQSRAAAVDALDWVVCGEQSTQYRSSLSS